MMVEFSVHEVAGFISVEKTTWLMYINLIFLFITEDKINFFFYEVRLVLPKSYSWPLAPTNFLYEGKSLQRKTVVDFLTEYMTIWFYLSDFPLQISHLNIATYKYATEAQFVRKINKEMKIYSPE